MEEKEYYYDENGERNEVGPSFKDYPGMAIVISPIPLCHACENAEFDQEGHETLCKVCGKIPKEYMKAKKYDCPNFDNENNGWYQLIKDKVEEAKGEKNG